jgi:ribosomal protein L28
MARCIVCNKGTVSGNLRSHAETKNRRTWKPNLQKTPHRSRWEPQAGLCLHSLSEKRKSTESSVNPSPML